MKNKGSGHITENELDGLLNEAFLNLDFEANAVNKNFLSAISKQTMTTKNIFDFFTSYRFHILFLIFSLIVCLSSFYRYVNAFDISKKENIQFNAQSNPVGAKQAVEASSQEKTVSYKMEAFSGIIEKAVRNDKSTANTKSKITVPIPKKENKGDSTLIVANIQAASRVADSLSQKTREDSLHGLEQIQSTTVSAAVINPPAKSQKKIKKPLPEVTSKTGKRSTSRKFRKGGTFRMKGGKYGKSKHP